MPRGLPRPLSGFVVFVVFGVLGGKLAGEGRSHRGARHLAGLDLGHLFVLEVEEVEELPEVLGLREAEGQLAPGATISLRAE